MDSRLLSWRYVEGDALLCEGPCELVSMMLSQSSTPLIIRMINGTTTSAPRVFDIRALNNESLLFTPSQPIYLSAGLYVQYLSGGGLTFVQWRKLPRK